LTKYIISFKFFINFSNIAPLYFFCFLYNSRCFYHHNLVVAVKFSVLIMAKTRGARDINEREQKAIIEGRKQGRTHEQLAQQFGISKSAVIKFLKHWKTQGDYIKKKKTGRPRCTTSIIDRNILRTARSNPRLTAPEILKEILPFGESNPSVRTIRRRLQAGGLYGRRAVKKPFISEKNRKVRIEWAKAHLNWTPQQ
jgi:transposase